MRIGKVLEAFGKWIPVASFPEGLLKENTILNWDKSNNKFVASWRD